MGRGDALIYESLGVRFAIFKDLLESVGLFSFEFGAATQTAVLCPVIWALAKARILLIQRMGQFLANIGIIGFRRVYYIPVVMDVSSLFDE